MIVVKPDHVLCYVCEGTKKSPSSECACLCCKGEGQVTKDCDDMLARIRDELGRAMLCSIYVSWQ